MLRTKLAAAGGALVTAAALAAGLAAPAEAATGYIEITSGTQHEKIVDPGGCLSMATAAPDVRLTVANHTDQTIRLYARPSCPSSGTRTNLAPGDSATGSFASIYAPPS